MKNACAMAICLLVVLAMSGWAQIRNPREAPAGDHPLIKAYVIELKYLLPDEAVQMLQGEGSRLKAFVPQGLTIDAVPKSMKLLVQTTDAQAALRLTQLISLIDQPGRLVLQPMLIILPPPGKSVGMPPPPTNTPIEPEAVQSWVQSLIDTYQGSVILFADQAVTNKQQIILQPVPLAAEMPVVIVSRITPDQSGMNQDTQELKAFLSILTGNVTISGAGKVRTGVEPPTGTEHLRVEASAINVTRITLVMNQSTMISIKATEGEKQYILVLTPKIIPPAIPELAPGDGI